MIPKITAGGSSFKGAFQYYMHDKGADTCERVAWTHTENLRSRDVTKAWKAMAYTARAQERLKEASGQSRAGRKLEKPVFAFSLAWHPEQSPTPDHMLDTARKAIAVLGLQEHEAVYVAHQDEPQKHVHVIVNRVHPLTGLAGDVRNSKRKLSDFARAYERTDGKIYCQQREANHQKRQRGETTRYRDPHIVKAWETTKTGKALMVALKYEGYTLAQGDKRTVVVDPNGKAYNLARVLGVKTKDVRARLSDIDIAGLPRVRGLQSAALDIQKEKAKRSREVFEHIAEQGLTSLKRKHRDEYVAAETQRDHRLDHSKKQLAAYYNLPKLKSNLKALKENIRHAPLWKRLLGITSKDRQQFYDQARSYQDAVSRYREKVAGIVAEGERAVSDLQTRQLQERQSLEWHNQTQREAIFGSSKEGVERAAPERLASEFNGQSQSSPKQAPKKSHDGRMESNSRSYPL